MNERKFNEALNHLDEDLVARHLLVKEKISVKQSRFNIRKWHKIMGMVAMIAIVIISRAFFIPTFKENNVNNVRPKPENTSSIGNEVEQFHLPVDENQILWYWPKDESGAKTDLSEVGVAWNDIIVSENLYVALSNITDNEYVAVHVSQEGELFQNLKDYLEQGTYCGYVREKNIYLFVKKSDLANLKFENSKECTFYHTSKAEYEQMKDD